MESADRQQAGRCRLTRSMACPIYIWSFYRLKGRFWISKLFSPDNRQGDGKHHCRGPGIVSRIRLILQTMFLIKWGHKEEGSQRDYTKNRPGGEYSPILNPKGESRNCFMHSDVPGANEAERRCRRIINDCGGAALMQAWPWRDPETRCIILLMLRLKL